MAQFTRINDLLSGNSSDELRARLTYLNREISRLCADLDYSADVSIGKIETDREESDDIDADTNGQINALIDYLSERNDIVEALS